MAGQDARLARSGTNNGMVGWHGQVLGLRQAKRVGQPCQPQLVLPVQCTARTLQLWRSLNLGWLNLALQIVENASGLLSPNAPTPPAAVPPQMLFLLHLRPPPAADPPLPLFLPQLLCPPHSLSTLCLCSLLSQLPPAQALLPQPPAAPSQVLTMCRPTCCLSQETLLHSYANFLPRLISTASCARVLLPKLTCCIIASLRPSVCVMCIPAGT